MLKVTDEAVHLSGTQHVIKIMQKGDDDPEMAEIAEECKDECRQMFIDAAEEEKAWAEYLFKDGSMIGLNKEILCQYVEYLTNSRMKAVKLGKGYDNAHSNPIPWINSWLYSDNVQVAPQETEISSYLVGQVDSAIDISDFSDYQDL